jgi:hypothetical protein
MKLVLDGVVHGCGEQVPVCGMRLGMLAAKANVSPLLINRMGATHWHWLVNTCRERLCTRYNGLVLISKIKFSVCSVFHDAVPMMCHASLI